MHLGLPKHDFFIFIGEHCQCCLPCGSKSVWMMQKDTIFLDLTNYVQILLQ